MIRTKVSALLSVAFLLVAACSNTPTETAQGDGTRLGGGNKKSGAKQKEGKPSKKVLKEAREVGEKAAAGSDEGKGSVTGSKAAGQPPGETKVSTEIRPEYARRSASVEDPRDDAKKQGVTPDYAEIIGASVQGLGEDFRLTLSLAGQVPERTQDEKTHMIVAFGITGSSQNEGYSFGAQARPDGWQAYAGGSDEGDGEFPGTFEINGSQIVMTIPWDYIKGPRAFEWYAASNWFSQLANTTHYKVDLAPSEGLAKFPQ